MIVGETVKDIDIDMPSDSYDTGKYMPTFNAYLTAIVRDSKGKVIIFIDRGLTALQLTLYIFFFHIISIAIPIARSL